MTNFLRLPFEFQTAALQASLAEIPPEAWRESNSPYTVRQTYHEAELIEPQHGKFHENGVPIFDFKPFISAESYFREVRQTFNCILESFRLTRLTPDAEIQPHRDFMYGFEHGLIRIHIPVTSSARSEIYFESGPPLVMSEGECWYGNFAVTHHLKNTGKDDRHHIIMDCRVNEWVVSLMRQSGFDCNVQPQSDS